MSDNKNIAENESDSEKIFDRPGNSQNDDDAQAPKKSNLNQAPVKKVKAKTGKKHRGGIIAGCIAGAVILAAAGYGIYVSGYEGVMPNTYVEDVNISGMTQEEASAALGAVFTEDKLADKTINFHCMDSSSVINIANLSMNFEPEKTASDAYSAGRGEPGFINKLKSFTSSLLGRREMDPVVSYDEQALTGAITDLCSPYEKEPLGYTYRLGGNNDIIIAKPQQGVKVDMNEAVEQVLDKIYTFTFGDVTFVPEITDAEPLDLDAFYQYITSPAVDAQYAKDENNKVYVVPSKPQIIVSKSEVERAVNQPEIEYSIPVQTVEPAKNAQFLQSVMYEDTLGTYTTYYGGSSGSRSNNISVCSNTISGIELLPGERFDFNKVVGQRTAARGYLPAPVYVVKNGETVSETDYGGGICQVSSTIFCAVNRAGLDVIERTSHSKDVTYVPKGMDATVSWGGPEFIFENSTDYPIRIFLSASGATLSATIVGSKVSVPDGKITVQNDGNNVVATRTYTDGDGNTVQEVFDSSNPPLPPPTEITAVSTAAADAEGTENSDSAEE